MTDNPRVGILTISDRSARGERADASGPVIRSFVEERLKWTVVAQHIVPDERGGIREALIDWCDSTTGESSFVSLRGC